MGADRKGLGRQGGLKRLESGALFINPRAGARQRQYGARERAVLNASAFADAFAAIRAWEGYAQTPLHTLPDLAARLGIGALWLKDESGRFGLGSFKALGGAYAVARLAADHAGDAPLTVTCATDGNHGRAVAWGARRCGCRCVIFVHEGVSAARVDAIAALGAEVRRVAGNYDDSVRHAAAVAAAQGWTVVSDTSYAGYAEIPRLVMQGYAVLAHEALQQLGEETPTHVFLQGGVGGFAAAVVAHFWEVLGKTRPRAVVVEPERADCLLRSARAGAPQTVHGALDTIMAGLACGEPSLLAWEILEPGVDAFLRIADAAAIDAMRLLAAREPPLVIGESGVAGLAGLIASADDERAREALGLTPNSRVLVVGTEGATDPAFYAAAVGQLRHQRSSQASAGMNDQATP